MLGKGDQTTKPVHLSSFSLNGGIREKPRSRHDFMVGQEFRHVLSRTITEIDCSILTLNPQPLHIDADFAASTSDSGFS